MKRIGKMRRPTSRARVKTIVRPQSDCAIIPQKQKERTPIRQFPTVCVRNCASSNRPSPQQQPCKRGRIATVIGGLDYRVTLSTTVCTALLVPFTVLCATFFAVITVFFATFLAVRTGPACALSTLPTQRPNARNIENNAFMVPKIS